MCTGAVWQGVRKQQVVRIRVNWHSVLYYFLLEKDLPVHRLPLPSPSNSI